MAQKQKRPQGDATGRQREEAAAAHAEEQAEAAKQMAMASAQQQAVDQNATFDPVTGEPIAEDDSELPPDVEVLDPEEDVVDLGVETAEDEDRGIQIRVNDNYPNVTIGQETYNFEAGKKYVVPRHVAAHLEEKGCVWH